jgi:hypothetical protein
MQDAASLNDDLSRRVLFLENQLKEADARIAWYVAALTLIQQGLVDPVTEATRALTLNEIDQHNLYELLGLTDAEHLPES